MNPYASLARGQYSNADVMAELQQSAQPQPTNPGYTSNPGYYPSANYFNPKDAYPQYPAAYSGGTWDSAAQKQQRLQDMYGSYEPQGQAVYPPGFRPAQWSSQAEFFDHMKQFRQDDYKAVETQYSSDIYEGAVDVQWREGQVVAERMLDVRHEVINQVRPVYTYEKIVEVPQVIIKETQREVAKPEIIERILEVPKTEIQERTITGPPQVQYREQLVEVPRVVIEERVIHVPRREIQERLIEVPKVQYVYRDEYEDFVEYREVPVDKIVEVPEVEYRAVPKLQFVDQTYIQEYYVDKYKDVPITQVQEVERVEYVPMPMPQQGGKAEPFAMGAPPSPPVPPVPPAGYNPYGSMR